MARRLRLHVSFAPLLAGVLAIALGSCASTTRDAPNVLLILVDDLGFGDLGANGALESHTPQMDRLAGEGARFTRHYADSSCAPSRAALLTGRHPARAGFRPRGRGLPAEVTTLPELLRERGYATRHLGKWHLGGTGIWGLDASPASALPSAHGFDHWFGFLDSILLLGPDPETAKAQTRFRYRRGRNFWPWLLGSDAPGTYYREHLTDLLTERAVEFIRSPHEGPWFLNLWYFAPHGPIQRRSSHSGATDSPRPSRRRNTCRSTPYSPTRLTSWA